MYHFQFINLSNIGTPSSPNTNDLFIHYVDKDIGTPPFIRTEGTSKTVVDRNTIHELKNCIFISVAAVLEVSKITVPI